MRGSKRRGRVAALALAACACGTDIRDVSRAEGPVIVTYRAPQTPAGLETFALVSRIGRVSADPNVTETSAEAAPLLAQLAAALEAGGLRKVADVDPALPPPAAPADLAVNVTALEVDPATPTAWEGAAGHLAPAGFGLPGRSWGYPWEWAPVASGASALLVEIADLRDAASGADVEVLWAALCPDAFGVGGPYDGAAALAALAQALAQTPPLAAGALP